MPQGNPEVLVTAEVVDPSETPAEALARRLWRLLSGLWLGSGSRAAGGLASRVQELINPPFAAVILGGW